ncbi:DUF3515 domain-containing protein [Corynebacterium vitaeruminis]|uniref:DUF3515 domain-containing protein n=1 Tax=Corynebacterium vitaeruminis TaxID=38305 RepID=UPI00046D5942|nr:DUF3515 domain-containing protein [Corynebacterium vitaeruminis]
MDARQDNSFKRTPILLALILALVLVVGVMVGAKLVYQKAANQPVGMSVIDAPLASSEQCSQLVDALPAKFLGHKRAELVEPKPDGAAAWQSNSQQQITLRCGVNLPLQYTALSPTTTIDGTEWLRVVDTTPQSTLQTWYTVNRSPVVAISTDEEGLGDNDFTSAALNDALSNLDTTQAQPQPTPLTDLAAGESGSCSALADALPDEFGTDPTYSRYTGDQLGNLTAAWTVDGYEPVALRCGVAFPAAYQAGAKLQQINGVAWFEDTTVGNGTTAATYYSVNRTNVVAVSVPQASGDAALVEFTKAIEQTIASTE